MLPRTQHGERPALAPGSTPAASAASRPACSAEDLPLPDGPTIPRNGVPVTRATSSATSRSRPKKNPASPAWKGARPLYGQTAASPASSASNPVRSPAACSLTMLPTRSSSAARSPDRSAVMRPTDCGEPAQLQHARPLRRHAVQRLRQAAAGGQQALDRHVDVLGRARIEVGQGAHAVGVQRLQDQRPAGRREAAGATCSAVATTSAARPPGRRGWRPSISSPPLR